ncbi:MAG TPA: hypothetical protein VNM92_06835 [Thermoanaerobaculia bacterium]|nr:hypothetical protein [Thermoanaerobaculia bacterium]
MPPRSDSRTASICAGDAPTRQISWSSDDELKLDGRFSAQVVPERELPVRDVDAGPPLRDLLLEEPAVLPEEEVGLFLDDVGVLPDDIGLLLSDMGLLLEDMGLLLDDMGLLLFIPFLFAITPPLNAVAECCYLNAIAAVHHCAPERIRFINDHSCVRYGITT